MNENLRDNANKAYKEGKYKETTHLYHQILENDPKDALSHQGLAQSLHKVGDLDESMQECYRALELQPDLAIPHMVLGKIMLRKGNFEESESEIQRATIADPSLVEAYNVLGALRINQKKYKESVDVLSKAIEMAPNAWLPHHLLALAHFDGYQIDQAYAEEKLALKLRPSLETISILSYLFFSKHRLIIGILITLLTIVSAATQNLMPIILITILFLLASVLSYRSSYKRQSLAFFFLSLFPLGLYLLLKML